MVNKSYMMCSFLEATQCQITEMEVFVQIEFRWLIYLSAQCHSRRPLILSVVTWDTVDKLIVWVPILKGSIASWFAWVLKSKGSFYGCFFLALESEESDVSLVLLLGPFVPWSFVCSWHLCSLSQQPEVGLEWTPFHIEGDTFTSAFPLSVTVTPCLASVLL
jgi:hypothetical protein